MANERNPNDPSRASDPNRASDPYRPNLGDDDVHRQVRLDNELQVDPELAEGPASGGKVAIFAVAVAVLLGAVFYGLNSSSINQAGSSSTAQNTAPATAQNTGPTSPPAAPSGMRDVTPRANTEQGTTIGAAPARPQTPPSPAPAGSPADAPAGK
jgi:hypothetical protein